MEVDAPVEKLGSTLAYGRIAILQATARAGRRARVVACGSGVGVAQEPSGVAAWICGQRDDNLIAALQHHR